MWALQQLGGALSLIADADDLSKALTGYEATYQDSFAEHTFARLGLLRSNELREDLQFLQTLFAWMTETGANWPHVFFDWFGGEASAARATNSPQSSLYEAASFTPVRDGLYARTPDRPERLTHGYFQKPAPVDLVIDTVEALWAPITETDDWTRFEDTLVHIEQARLAYLG